MKVRKFACSLVLFAVFAGACGGGGGTQSGTKAGGFAMIMNGPISDADYNSLGYEATQAVGKQFGYKTGYSENIAIADAERVARDYATKGFTVISFHGGIYVPIARKLAPEFPDISWIAESSSPIENSPTNLWVIERVYYPAFYVMGMLAAKMSKTKTVGFEGPITFADGIKSANSFFAGARSADPTIKLVYTFIGDFVDPIKGRQGAQSLIDLGADVVVTFVNQAILGVAQACSAASRPTFFTALYTDKHSLATDRYLTAPVFSFTTMFLKVVTEIEGGRRTGNQVMNLETGGIVFEPKAIYNVPADVRPTLDKAIADAVSGKLQVPLPNATSVVVPPI